MMSKAQKGQDCINIPVIYRPRPSWTIIRNLHETDLIAYMAIQKLKQKFFFHNGEQVWKSHTRLVLVYSQVKS